MDRRRRNRLQEYKKKDMVPVQTYIPVEHYKTFVRKYKKRGAISNFIRQSFQLIYDQIMEEKLLAKKERELQDALRESKRQIKTTNKEANKARRIELRLDETGERISPEHWSGLFNPE